MTRLAGPALFLVTFAIGAAFGLPESEQSLLQPPTPSPSKRGSMRLMTPSQALDLIRSDARIETRRAALVRLFRVVRSHGATLESPSDCAAALKVYLQVWTRNREQYWAPTWKGTRYSKPRVAEALERIEKLLRS